jgi:hypothetical protein
VIHCADDRPSRHLATAGIIGWHIQGRGAQTRKTRLEGRAIASISYEYLLSEGMRAEQTKITPIV